uniref:FMN-binding protein n=1 Tax=Fervidicoccus fontis TaxID=683846 RepID=A0A7C1ICM3_9CREN
MRKFISLICFIPALKSEAFNCKIDAVTGATISSGAIVDAVKNVIKIMQREKA